MERIRSSHSASLQSMTQEQEVSICSKGACFLMSFLSSMCRLRDHLLLTLRSWLVVLDVLELEEWCRCLRQCWSWDGLLPLLCVLPCGCSPMVWDSISSFNACSLCSSSISFFFRSSSLIHPVITHSSSSVGHLEELTVGFASSKACVSLSAIALSLAPARVEHLGVAGCDRER